MTATTETPARARTAGAATPTEVLGPAARRYAVLGGAALVLALAAWLFVMLGNRKEAFAARALDQATGVAESGNLPLAASELQKVISGYAGTRAAQEASIRLNQVRLVNGQAELAAVGLREFLKGNPDAQFQSTAYGLLGRALENAGKPAEAAEAYQKSSETASVDYLRAEHLLDAGRAFRNAGQRDQAIAAYQRILKDFATTSAKTEAEVRLAELTVGAS
jgi:TolA-binding protein